MILSANINTRKMAERIARNLFINGSGQRASRLVLESPQKRDLGGWCESAVVDQVERALEAGFSVSGNNRNIKKEK